MKKRREVPAAVHNGKSFLPEGAEVRSIWIFWDFPRYLEDGLPGLVSS